MRTYDIGIFKFDIGDLNGLICLKGRRELCEGETSRRK